MPIKTRALAALALSLCSFVAKAADEADTGKDIFSLGVVEVIGQVPETPPAGAERLDFDQIERMDKRDVGTALNLLPGVTLQSVGQRRERMVYIRGFNSRQIPIYIDGVPVYVPYDGNIDLARFGVDYLSSIVVTKGLTSVLYGPNALGGSVNLVSRRPTAPFEASAGVGADFDRTGDFAGWQTNARLGARRGDWYAQATASYADNRFFRVPSDFRSVAAEDGGRRNNSASSDRLFTAKLGWMPNATDEYTLSFYRQDGEKQDPPYTGSVPGTPARYWRWPDWDKESVYFISRTALGEDTDLRLRAYYDSFYNELDSYDDATYTTQTRPYAFKSTYDDFTTGASAELEQRWTQTQITRLALHAKRDVHREISAVGAPQQYMIDRTYSFGVEHEWKPSAAWTITPGVAYNRLEGKRADNLVGGDTIEPFGVETNDATNAQIAAAYAFAPDSRAFVGVSRKTRFPTLKDRYSYRMGSALPNPDLAAERSTNFELGVEGRAGRFGYRAAVFESRLSEAIDTVSLPSDACNAPPCTQLRNIGKARNRGIELAGDVNLAEQLSLSANYTLIDRSNRTHPELKPTDTPRQKLFAALDWRFATNWSALLGADSESRRYSTTDGKRIAPGFTVYDASVKWQARPDFGVTFGIHNLGDKLYMFEEGFPEPGRTYYFHADYRY